MAFSKYLFISLALTLGGCGVPAELKYQEPTGTGNSTIHGTWKRDGMAFWRRVNIEQVDYKLTDKTEEAKIAVAPGKRIVTVYTYFNNGFDTTCPCTSRADITFDVKPNNDYTAIAETKGAETHFWIEDMAGKTVSEIVKSNYTDSR